MIDGTGFAAVPNWMIRDQRFDIYDIAVFAALASHTGPGGVRPSQATLAEEARCSERKVRDVIQKLTSFGLVEVVQRRRATAGKATRLTNGYVLHPHGALSADDEPAELPARGAASSKLPAHGNEATGTREQITPLIEEEPVEEEPVVSDRFDEFWSVYPRKSAKPAARKAWAKACRSASAEVVLAGARRFAADPNLPEKQFIPMPTTWLNQGRWDDEPLPERRQEPMRGYVADDDWMNPR